MDFYEAKLSDIIEPELPDLEGFKFEPLDNLPLPPLDGPGERGQDVDAPWPYPD